MEHPVLGKVIHFVIPIDYTEIFLRRRSMLASPATPLPVRRLRMAPVWRHRGSSRPG